MFPLDFAIASQQTETSWFEPIWNDGACLHLTLFTTNTYLGTLYGRQTDRQSALLHFSEALRILQRRLDIYQDAATSDSTILVVVGLTMAASALGDYGTAAKHLAGLHRMIALRGGLSRLKGAKLLQSKVCR